jgi:FPC/CPF motif-containing protein YcgG
MFRDSKALAAVDAEGSGAAALAHPFDIPHRPQADLEARFQQFVRDRDFPCVGAKSALGRGTLKTIVCRSIASAWDDLRIHEELRRWAESYRRKPGLFRSLAVIFEGPDDLDETAFEQVLWKRIQSVTDKDVWRGLPADERVSSNPADPHFSLSFGGEAFFVVGLHPRASRPARRFNHPVMVFNLHDQFETLRAEGRYDSLRQSILERDRQLAGSINPMLARHGETSEARQYSGRRIDEGWVCPFHRRDG